ncbi:cobalamin-dependent protein [Nitrospinaceae bacterium]|nr:cobalamin-dependent protein [Nitrospinaceae bacterium]
MKSRKLKIYLADLIHDRHFYNYCVPLNVGYIAATLNSRLGEDVETKIHKFPDDLISEMKASPPDILALSNYDWNVNLNQALIQIARKINPQIFIMMGGPNIKKKPEGVKDFLTEKPIDFYVVNEAEEAFSNVIEYILGSWPCDIKNTVISSGIKFPNTAYLEKETRDLMLGEKPESALAKDIPFPSPWLAGLMDQFINNTKFPLQALIETNRNCPYQCHFCVWGDFDLNKIRIFDFNTVIEELRYVFKKSEFNFNLWFADANFGILDRDIEFAEELRRLSDKYKKVGGVYLAQAKDSLNRNFEISKILGKLCIPEFAVQTLTPGILEVSGRKNPSNEKIREYVAKVKENRNEVYTDILLGLPGESKEQFIDSMAKVIDFGFHSASVADIRLLDGGVMNESEFREEFGIESGFRVIPSAYGEYDGIRVIEYEECIRKTMAMSTEDLLELRLFNANYFLLYFIELGRPILDFIQKNGLHPITLIADISKNIDKTNYPVLSEHVERFTKTAADEWYESPQEVNQYYLQPEMFNKIMKEGFPKLNYEYAAELLTRPDLRSEYMEWIGENIKKKLEGKDSVIDELVSFCVQRVYSPPFINKQDVMELSFNSANHLTKYANDYNHNELGRNSDEEKKVDRVQGETRNTIGSVFSKEGSNLYAKSLNINSSFKLKFDTDREKTKWLKNEIDRNGGSNNILLTIQVMLQFNQKAFLRSWSIQ